MKMAKRKSKSRIGLILNTLKLKSIQFIITVSFTLTTIIAMICIGFTLYNKYSNAAEQNVKMSTQQIIDQVSLNMDYYQKSIREISDLIDSSIGRQSVLPNNKLEEQMNVILDTRDDLVSIAIFTEKGELVMGNPFPKLKKDANVVGQNWFQQAINNNDGLLFSPPHVQNLFEGKHNWVVSHSRKVNFIYNGKEEEGILLIDMNFSSIDQLCRKASLGKRGYIYIIDSDGKIVYHPQQELIYAGLKHENNETISKVNYSSFIQDFDNEKRMVTVKPVSYMGWKIVGISYMDELLASKRELIEFSAWILFFGMIFVIAVFIFISAKITKPIKQLEASMKLVEEGCLDVNVDISGGEEVAHLSKTFNLMIKRIRELMNQILLEQEAQRKSELNALQAQINPHFLYNTLDSIVWMAENGKTQDVITMVTALARLFRISISRGKNIITVQEELEHARNYLIIQKVRYKNKFQFDIKVEGEAFQYKTLKLILQPIIENAIYHGIEYMVDEGRIDISVHIRQDKLVYEVKDNGLGMSEEKVKNILSKDSKSKENYGVGVKNVHERIRLCFGDGYGIKIESELEEGTKVKIILPLINEEEEIQNENKNK